MNPNSRPPVPRLRERFREATTEAILDAAEQAFAAEGPRARMESIASRAGIAVGTLYNHFADRDALWTELARSRREALLVRLDAALEGARGLPFRGALCALLEAFLEHWITHRGFLAVLIQAEPIGARSPRAGTKDRTMASELLERVSTLVRRGVDSGELRVEGADLHAVLLMGMIRAVLFQHLGGESRDPHADLEQLIESFLHGAARRTGWPADAGKRP